MELQVDKRGAAAHPLTIRVRPSHLGWVLAGMALLLIFMFAQRMQLIRLRFAR